MKKALKITGITVVSLIVILAIIPFAFEGKIYETIQKKANENLNATLSFSDVDLSLLRNFPNLRVSINDLKVVNKAPFDGISMADIKSFSVVINIKSLFTDEIEIRQILLEKPNLDIRVLADGKANYDIAIPDSAKPEPEEPSKPVKLSLKKYAIDEGNIRFDDKSLAMVMDFKNLNFEGNGDFAEDVFTMSTLTTADKGTFWFDGVTYANEANTEIKADLAMDLGKMKFEFKDNEVRLNQLYLQANGWVSMPEEDIDMDIQFGATKTDFKNLLSMVPMEFAKDLEGVDATGKIGLNGFVKGTYNDQSMPNIGLKVNIENGRFKYPDLPKSVDDVQVDLNVYADMNNEDNTVIDLNKCQLKIASNPIDMVLHLKTPKSNPYIDFKGKLNIDLSTLKDVIPIGKEEKIMGIIDADMMFKGNVNGAESGNFNGLQAEGKLNIKNFDYISDSLPYDIFVEDMALNFTPQQANLSNLAINVGKSKMKMNGSLTHYLEYAIKNEKLVGVLNFESPEINLNDFMSTPEEEVNKSEETAENKKAPTDTTSSVVVLPNNIDFTLNSKIQKLTYDKTDFTNVGGQVRITDGKAIMNNLGLNGLGGTLTVNGEYDGNEGIQPSMNMNIDMNNVDIKTTTTTFVTLEKWSQAAKNCAGKISMRLDLKTMLDKQMMPINASVDAKGNIKTDDVVLTGYVPMIKLAEKTGLDKWKQPIHIKDVNVNFTIQQGIIKVQPFTVKVDDIPVKMEGQATLDQKIDYTLETDVPLDKFPSGLINQANSFIGQINNKLGTQLKPGNKINLIARITGDVTNPEVKVTSKALGEEAVQDLKEQAVQLVKEEVVKQATEFKNDALEKAKAEKEKLVQEAAKQAEKIKSEARAAAEKAKSQAYAEAEKVASKGGNFIEKAANKKLAEEMKKSADKAYAKSIAEADKKADQLVKDANTKGDQLIQKANESSDQQINKIK